MSTINVAFRNASVLKIKVRSKCDLDYQIIKKSDFEDQIMIFTFKHGLIAVTLSLIVHI